MHWNKRFRRSVAPARALTALAMVVIGCGAAWAQDLSTLYAAARDNDATFRAARHALDAARQRAPQARGALLPQLSYSASRQEQKGPLFFAEEDPVDKDVESRSRTLQLTQGIVRPEQWMALRQANAFEAQAEAQFQSAQQALILRVVQAYLDAWVASESLRVSAVQLNAVQAQQGLAQRNFEVGATTVTDVYEAQAKYDLTLAQSIGARNDLATRLAELERMLGFQPERLHGIADDAPLPGAQLDPMALWLERARASQPDAQVAQAAVAVAQADHARSMAGFLPTLDLTLKKGTDRSSGSMTSPTDVAYRTRSTQAALTLNWPLFEGGQSYYRVREGAYQMAKADAELDAAQRQATTAVRQAYAGIRSGHAQLKALASGLLSSKKALDASKVGYRIGTRINIDVLNAENQYFSAQRDLAKARADTVMQWVKLKAAAGELNDDSVQQVNAWLEKDGQPVGADVLQTLNESPMDTEPRRNTP